MKKRIIFVLFFLLLLSQISFSAVAASTSNALTEATIPENRLLPRLLDEADVLTTDEESEVLAVLDEISERQQFDVVIATVNDFTQVDVKNAAYDYYDYNGFGYGEAHDGILLYLSMSERDLNICATGFGIDAFTDYGREQILTQIKPELGEDAFYTAFLEFAQLSDVFVTEAKNGTPYDIDHPVFENEMGMDSFLFLFGCGILVSACIALLIVKSAERKLTSVRNADNAREYIREGSIELTRKRDHFVRSKETSRYDPEDEGGSTVDTGSSGVAHSSTSSKF